MESPWCHRCTLLLFEGKHVECNFRQTSPCTSCAQHEEQTGECILCEPTIATFTTKTEHDEMKNMIEEQARIAAQLYATLNADSEERSSESAMKSMSALPRLKRSADSASLDDCSDDGMYSPRHDRSLSPPPSAKKVRFGVEAGEISDVVLAKVPNQARDLFPRKVQQSGRWSHHHNLIDMSKLLPQEYRDKRSEIRDSIMGDQPQVKLLTQSQLIHQLKRSLQSSAADAMAGNTDPHVFEHCDRKLIGWSPTQDPDRAALRKEKMEARIQQQKQEIGKLEKQLRSTSHQPRSCPYFQLGRCTFGDNCKWVHPPENARLFSYDVSREDGQESSAESGPGTRYDHNSQEWLKTMPERLKSVDEQVQRTTNMINGAGHGQHPTLDMGIFNPTDVAMTGYALPVYTPDQIQPPGLAQLLQSKTQKHPPFP